VARSKAVIDRELPLRVTLDDDANAAYIYVVKEIASAGVARTVVVDHPLGMINLDFNSGDHLLGVEILNSGRLLPAELVDRLHA
jgi:hypothetical protein